MSAPTLAQLSMDALPHSPRAMASAGGLHPFGVLVLLAGAFLPIADFFIVNVALPTIDRTLHAAGPTLELIVLVLADVPAHHAGIGGGTLITLQQAGLALGVATLGTLYLALEPGGIAHAFAAAVGVQLAIVVLLVLATRALPSFRTATTNQVVVDA